MFTFCIAVYSIAEVPIGIFVFMWCIICALVHYTDYTEPKKYFFMNFMQRVFSYS